MSTASAISQTGMQAAQTALDASAHNLANLSTAGFRREQVAQSTVAEGGVQTSLSQAAEAGSAIEADVVAQILAKHVFLANLDVFKSNDVLMGALLDAKG